MIMSLDWFTYLEKAEKTVVAEDNTLKVHYKFADDVEMAEEYNIKPRQILRRAWKNKNHIHKDPNHWDIELGEDQTYPPNVFGNLMRESKNTPYVIKKIDKDFIEWRIRNLAYPIENYEFRINEDDEIIISTKNKKFYKVLPLLELQRLKLKGSIESLDYKHFSNCLIVRYKKPSQLTEVENKIFEMVRKLENSNRDQLPCKPS